ncbi:hypothetical protein TARUN_9340 [Trichoderma arundinaceum]|uniref:Uncharacterized protein n=1 Tax=Trichoderma arundinaceum TaxID=490622 RepID=A0A395N9Y4_TRIAR|nr:hypothetical protein TARUN_9340 [Trichoderma arundinaceum]
MTTSGPRLTLSNPDLSKSPDSGTCTRLWAGASAGVTCCLSIGRGQARIKLPAHPPNALQQVQVHIARLSQALIELGRSPKAKSVSPVETSYAAHPGTATNDRGRSAFTQTPKPPPLPTRGCSAQFSHHAFVGPFEHLYGARSTMFPISVGGPFEAVAWHDFEA